jgi:cyanophycinase
MSGHLLVIGGALRADNAAVYEKYIELAGGRDAARIGIFSTASVGLRSSERFKEELVKYGVPGENVCIFDLTEENATVQAHSPQLVAQIARCTGIYFVGGDQLRITKALCNFDGSDTPALAAVREVYANGGVIAGSSAGAAIMSEQMLSAFGAPLDTLDGGLASEPGQLGVHVSKGLGFFKKGIVDQHFNTYNGRHARLARVLIEGKVRLGFGVDENTAMWVKGEEAFEVIGVGGVTLVDASEARMTQGPHGVTMKNVLLNYLESGDSYHLHTGEYTFNPKKTLIQKGDEYADGNRVVTDLTQTNAFNRAITIGLVDNTADCQVGLMLRAKGQERQQGHDPKKSYNPQNSHDQLPTYGYKFTFTKTPATRGYYGNVNGVDSYAARNVRMDVEPLSGAELLHLLSPLY